MSESHSATVNVRRYMVIFAIMIVSALLTVGITLAPLGNPKINIGLALVVIAFQAFLVLGFMMHLLSERRTIYCVLGFTAFFLVALMFMTISSMNGVVGKSHQEGNTVTHFER